MIRPFLGAIAAIVALCIVTPSSSQGRGEPMRQFIPLGSWHIELYVDNVLEYGPHAFYPLRRNSKQMMLTVRADRSSLLFQGDNGVAPTRVIPDGVERRDPEGYTRYFYLGPTAFGHTHRSATTGIFDSDVCIPSPDGKTITCAGFVGGPDGKLHSLLSVWHRKSDSADARSHAGPINATR
jgi:hypothetical protein